MKKDRYCGKLRYSDIVAEFDSLVTIKERLIHWLQFNRVASEVIDRVDRVDDESITRTYDALESLLGNELSEISEIGEAIFVNLIFKSMDMYDYSMSMPSNCAVDTISCEIVLDEYVRDDDVVPEDVSVIIMYYLIKIVHGFQLWDVVDMSHIDSVVREFLRQESNHCLVVNFYN